MSRFEANIERYCHWILKHPVRVVLVSLVIASVCMAGSVNLRFVSDVRIFFSQDDPALMRLERIERTYTKVNDILITLRNPDERIFNPRTLAAIEQLTKKSWQLKYAYRVDSVTNYQHSFVEGDDLLVSGLFDGLERLSAAEIDSRAEVALSEPRLLNRLVAADGHSAAVVVTFQIPDDEAGYAGEVVAQARELIAETAAGYPELELYLTGSVALDNALIESALSDGRTLMPLMFGAIIFILVLLLRSIYATLAVLVLVILSTGSAIGLAGWLGIDLSMAVVPAPAMVMTLAVADAIHILVLMFLFAGQGMHKHEALMTSIKRNLMPVFLTSFTTAMGFLALNFNPVEPFRDLGNIAAMGIAAALLFSLSLLPALVMILPIDFKLERRFGSGPWLSALGELVISRRGTLIGVFLVLAVLAAILVPRNELNNNFVEFFDSEIEFRRDTDATMRHLTGIYLIEYSIPGEGSNGVADPEYLRDLAAYVQWLREQPEVMHVNSISDVFKRLNQNMHGGDTDWYRLPEERDLAAQYLLLYELSLPYGLDLNNELNQDRSSSRLMVTLKDISTSRILDFSARSEAWLRDHTPWSEVKASGSTMIFAQMYQRTTAAMVEGTLISLVVITVLLMLTLGSLKYALLSLIPNILPAAFAFGLWSLLAGEVNMAVSMVLTMTIGIVVDDTIHFMSKYLAARRDGMRSFDAVRYCYQTVGSALVVTSVAIAVGFFILAQSSFTMNSQSALLSAITIVAALVTDLMLLPPLLMLIDSKDSRSSGAAPIPDQQHQRG